VTEPDARTAPTNASEVRERLVEALQLDLVGPPDGHPWAEENLPGWQRPSNWYLTGFLVPKDAPADQAADADENDELATEPGDLGSGDETAEERKAAKKGFFPSSIGLSVLVPATSRTLELRVTWGEYALGDVPDPRDPDATVQAWRRTPRAATLAVDVAASGPDPIRHALPGAPGLEMQVLVRAVPTEALDGHLPRATRSVSVFLVNRKKPDEERPDRAFVFQPRVEARCTEGFVPRPDLSGLQSAHWDDAVADLHYADTPEYATGHGVSADWATVDGACHEVRTAWIPSAEVERTVTAAVEGVELSMDALGALADADAARVALAPLPTAYRAWITARTAEVPAIGGDRASVAATLLQHAEVAATRIERGIKRLASDPDAFDAFRVANRAVARALRQRGTSREPSWRAFQLAFLLLNLEGIADPTSTERDVVDLLFFPTGGGKTEAYLGLAAFTIVLRRLHHAGDPGALTGSGVAVVMRYTLRLLTLDQLGRAAGLVCALELERLEDESRYGVWPFEIGLWVGKAATPNLMGERGDGRDGTARQKVNNYKQNSKRHPIPIPLETCPWCGTRFEPESFDLVPDGDRPNDLRIHCVNFECDFAHDRPLPIVAVDEPLYRRLPAFLIATVDKFASLPWTGPSGMLLGGAERHDAKGFYGPANPRTGNPLPSPLPPPDLIIQDELHLISGPLGTMAGLYETAIDALCTRDVGGANVRPKVIASTATARRAQEQVQALFARSDTRVFPPPGPDRRDSFFALVRPASETPARRYVGVAAQGRNPKVVMRRVWLALMGAAERAYRDAGGHEVGEANPADAYMTVLGYFNSLRELGGARRILEEEVRQTVREYGSRTRFGLDGLFASRRSVSDVLELTSRVPTHEVAEAKRRLELAFNEPQRVDSAIATNMISVGLDIQRLGLMVVVGQPKAHAEYIQATSRVGRDAAKPGLVVTLLNLGKPRDRSHYERFRHYHETFYRSVEAASVTPFAARALDRGLAGALVALARHAQRALTPPAGAAKLAGQRPALDEQLVAAFTARVRHLGLEPDERDALLHSLQSRVGDLLDAWLRLERERGDDGLTLHYQRYEDGGSTFLLREMLDRSEDPLEDKFRVQRSLRDVEPEVVLFLKDLPRGSFRDRT